jgi:uncharacterized metal-binding protein
MSKKVKVIPCSGIGKVYGLIARESVLKTVKELCPEESETVCLAYIVTGDKEASELVKGENCITLDGCPASCAKKNAELAGGIVKENMRVVDAFKRHKGAKPGTGTELTGEGWQIVDEIAGEIAGKVKKINAEDKQ